MKILLVPSVKETFKKQFELSVDINLIKFLNFTFGKKIIIEILNEKILKKPNLIILVGGNGLPNLEGGLHNSIRHKLNNIAYKYAIKRKIPVIGICLGAQFIGFKNNFKFKKKNFKGNHSVFLNENINSFYKKIYKVNSFHNFMITKINNQFKFIYKTNDNSIELFKSKTKKILGMMWHPERNKKFSPIDKKIFKGFYDNYNSFCR